MAANMQSDASKKPWSKPKLEQLSVRSTAVGQPAAVEEFKQIGPMTFQYQGPVAS